MSIDKKVNYEVQGGVKNYKPSKMVNVPKTAKSSPTHPTAHLAYITDEEKKLLIKKNLHGSLNGKPNKGPGGIPSLEGDFESYTSGMGSSSDDAGTANRENRRTSQYNSSPPQTSPQTPRERNRPNPQTDSGQSIDTYITPQQVKDSREFKRQQNEQRSSTGGGLNTLAKTALNFLIPGSNFLTSQGLGNTLGNLRKKFTGYGTQAEYDLARQQRKNLNRIRTIQNTLNTKYADGDYSNTDLDERLAGLQSLMGIVPNTAEQDAQQYLDFGNELAETTEATPQELLNEFTVPASTYDLAPQEFVNEFTVPLSTYDNIPQQFVSSQGIMSQVDDVPTDLEIFKKRFP